MNDFPTLTEAFAELERRADAVTASRPAEPAAPPRRHRLLLVAASVVAVSTVAVGATLLARDRGSSPSPQAAAGSRTATHSSPAVRAAFRIPETPDELAVRFRVVLGDLATFTVTDTGTPVTVQAPPAPTHTGRHVVKNAATAPAAKPNGSAIVGTLTSAGTTGGFDLQIFRASPGSKPMCDDPDRSRCNVRRLADGSWLAVGRERLPNSANGITYQVDLVRSDGVEFLMHVSNERSPKGASDVLATHPPLTTRQMTAIVTSDRW